MILDFAGRGAAALRRRGKNLTMGVGCRLASPEKKKGGEFLQGWPGGEGPAEAEIGAGRGGEAVVRAAPFFFFLLSDVRQCFSCHLLLPPLSFPAFLLSIVPTALQLLSEFRPWSRVTVD